MLNKQMMLHKATGLDTAIPSLFTLQLQNCRSNPA